MQKSLLDEIFNFCTIAFAETVMNLHQPLLVLSAVIELDTLGLACQRKHALLLTIV